MLTVYARRYSHNDVTELVQHSDGRVGLWSPKRQQWLQMWGNGLNQAGFINALLDWDGTLTAEGEAWIADRKAAVAK